MKSYIYNIYLGYNEDITSKFVQYNGLAFGSKISVFDIGDNNNQISIPTLLSSDLIPDLEATGNYYEFYEKLLYNSY